MQRQQHKTSSNVRNQGNITLPKDHNNLLVINSKDMEIYDIFNKEFKIAVLRKLNELQENRGRQYNEIRNTIHEQNEKLNKGKS